MHLGTAKTKSRAREVIWWPGMSSHLLEQAVSTCEIRALATSTSMQHREPLMTSPLPQRPWKRVTADLFTGEMIRICYWLITIFMVFGGYASAGSEGLKEMLPGHGMASQMSL